MRKRRKPRVLDDPEVLELLRDEPELLAVADAIHATLGAEHRRRRRHVQIARLSAAAAVIAVGSVLATVRPWQPGGPGLVEQALAAVPERGPVVHAVLRTDVPGEELIELATGRSLPQTSELEFWFDQRRGLLHTLVRRDGRLVADILASRKEGVSAAGRILAPQSPPQLRPALLGFATGYRAALARGDARPVGRALAGRGMVQWLEVETPLGRERVALDPKSLRPLEIRAPRPGGAASGLAARVLAIETLPVAAANFTRPRRARLGPSGGAVSESTPVSLAAARQVLSRPTLWAGPRTEGLKLRLVERQRLVRLFPAGSKARRHLATGVAVLYGAVRSGHPDWRSRFLQLEEAAAPEPAYGFLSGVLAIEPPPPLGFLRLERRPLVGSATGAIWRGQLRSGGLYLTLTASSRALVLAAGRALHPLATTAR